jgi:hypothetical protein
MAATTSTPRSEGVIVRRWMPDPAGLLELWRHEAPRTLRVVESFADRDLAHRPQRGARSVGELLTYIVASYQLTRHWLTSDAPPRTRESLPQPSVRRALASLTDRQN